MAFLDYIPSEYCGNERGVNVDGDQVVICADLIHTMIHGSYHWLDTHWVWDREMFPVEIKEGTIYSTINDVHYRNRMIWLYDNDGKRWHGWECYPHHKGTPVYWLVIDADKDGYVSDRPVDIEEILTDPAYQGVSLKEFFDISPNCGLYAIPTPTGEWTWAFWEDGGVFVYWDEAVYTRGFKLRVWTASRMVNKWDYTGDSGPEWLDEALERAMGPMPC